MNPVTGLSLARIALGTLAFVSPRLAARLFRLDGAGQPQLGYMSRMFASREIALGAATLAAPPALRGKVVAAGVVIDLADAASGALAGRDGAVSKPTSAFLAVPALAAAITGIVATRR